MKKDKSTPENRKFWEDVEEAAKVVDTWPLWKKGMILGPCEDGFTGYRVLQIMCHLLTPVPYEKGPNVRLRCSKCDKVVKEEATITHPSVKSNRKWYGKYKGPFERLKPFHRRYVRSGRQIVCGPVEPEAVEDYILQFEAFFGVII